MAPPPKIQHALLRAVARFGPGVTNSQIVSITKQHLWAVSMSISRAETNGLITVERTTTSRCIHITEAGHRFMADFELRGSASTSKPPQRSQGKAQRRVCLMCQKKFGSPGIETRVCRGCKSTDEWKSPANGRHVTQEVS